MKGYIILLAFVLNTITSISINAKRAKYIDRKPVALRKANLDDQVFRKTRKAQFKPYRKKKYYGISESESDSYDCDESDESDDYKKKWYKKRRWVHKKAEKPKKKKRVAKKKYYDDYRPAHTKKSILTIGDAK